MRGSEASGRETLSLHDVRTPRRFACRALDDELASRGGAWLPPDAHEEAIGYFQLVLCQLAERYDPAGASATRAVKARIAERVATRAEWRALQHYIRVRRRLNGKSELRELPVAGEAFATFVDRVGVERGTAQSFSTWAYRTLRKRYTDWLRQYRGDSRYGTWMGRGWSGGNQVCAHTKTERTPEGRDRCIDCEALSCQHELLRDDAGKPVDPQRCRHCGTARVGNDGREQAAADPNAHLGNHLIEDAQDFLAVIAEMDSGRLSERARGTLKTIGLYMSRDGLNLTEASARLGKSRREGSKDLDRLKEELYALNEMRAAA